MKLTTQFSIYCFLLTLFPLLKIRAQAPQKTSGNPIFEAWKEYWVFPKFSAKYKTKFSLMLIHQKIYLVGKNMLES